MTSAGWMKRFLIKNEFDINDWGTKKKSGYLDAPSEPGVYALYWGPTLQYLGRSKNLRRRLSQWDSEDLYRTDFRIPFGSFAWFTLPKDQVQDAEALLILYYDPPYNVVYPNLSE